MPNWVFNGLTIEGSPSSVQKLKEQMNKPYTKEEDQWNPDTNKQEVSMTTYSNPVFSFWNIVAPTDLVEYIKQPSFVQDEKVDRSDLSWYTWNLQNWGVKWDVAVHDGDEHPDTDLQESWTNGENTVLQYRFNTAWGTPDNALMLLSSQFPDLLLTNEFEEEQGWGGETEYLRGKATLIGEYNWKCQNCDCREAGEPPYCEECQEDVCPECLYSNAVQEDLCEEHNGSKRP